MAMLVKPSSAGRALQVKRLHLRTAELCRPSSAGEAAAATPQQRPKACKPRQTAVKSKAAPKPAAASPQVKEEKEEQQPQQQQPQQQAELCRPSSAGRALQASSTYGAAFGGALREGVCGAARDARDGVLCRPSSAGRPGRCQWINAGREGERTELLGAEFARSLDDVETTAWDSWFFMQDVHEWVDGRLLVVRPPLPAAVFSFALPDESAG